MYSLYLEKSTGNVSLGDYILNDNIVPSPRCWHILSHNFQQSWIQLTVLINKKNKIFRKLLLFPTLYAGIINKNIACLKIPFFASLLYRQQNYSIPCFHLKKAIKVMLLIKTKKRVNVFKSEIKRISSLC